MFSKWNQTKISKMQLKKLNSAKQLLSSHQDTPLKKNLELRLVLLEQGQI